MRIIFIQHGDYRETFERFDAGGDEVYYAQRYSDDLIAALTQRAGLVAVVCVSKGTYDEPLPNGVRAIGFPLRAKSRPDNAGLIRLVESLEPSHLISRTPNVELIRWAVDRGVRTLPMLADSFAANWRKWRHYRQLARCLNHRGVRWVCNHNVNAARGLERIGVNPEKIVPWDWPPVSRPEDHPVKSLDPDATSWKVIYVGAQRQAKGIGDVIQAVAVARQRGVDLSLTSVGGGDVEAFNRLAQEQGIDAYVTFTGRVPHSQALELMRQHDVVVVPSRHEYPEGLPMTIYDALTSRTPLITSDHPMFQGKIIDGVGGLVFRAQDPDHLAEKIQELLGDPGLYERLSGNSIEAFRHIECPAKWGDVIHHWLDDQPNDHRWLADHSLASGIYDSAVASVS